MLIHEASIFLLAKLAIKKMVTLQRTEAKPFLDMIYKMRQDFIEAKSPSKSGHGYKPCPERFPPRGHGEARGVEWS